MNALKQRTSYQKLAAALVVVMTLLLVLAPLPAQAATTTNLKAAQKKFGVTAAHTITAKTPNAINMALYDAGSMAKSSAPYIVYVPSGNYAMGQKLTVPKNVILVAEANSKFTAKTAANFTQFFMVQGSVYGGTYDGKNKAYYGLRFDNLKFDQKNNGYIIKAKVINTNRAGIAAVGKKCKGGSVLNCTVSKCGNSGISAVEGAWLSTVKGNTCSNNKYSGINLGHSNIDLIQNNTLTGNTGHGISTESEGSGQGYCYIKKITGNTIKKNGANGVYIEAKCHVETSFTKNVISGNKNNGLRIDANAYVKGIANNTFSGNGASNLQVEGKNANAYVKGGNKFTGAGNNNITINTSGRITIKGNKNVIKGAKNNGISINAKSKLIVSGSGNTVSGNKAFGIRLDGKSACEIQNVKFSGNGSFAVKVYRGSSITHSGTNLSTASSAANRLYME